MVPVADIGMPMLLFAGPVFVLGFIPIVGIEAVVVAKTLHLPIRSVIGRVLAGNLATTLVGIPLAWVATVVASGVLSLAWRGAIPTWVLVLLSPAWQLPDPKEPFWVVPVCNLILLVPFYFASVAIEWRYNKPLGEDWQAVRRATLLANLASYALLAAFWIAELKLHPTSWMYRTR